MIELTIFLRSFIDIYVDLFSILVLSSVRSSIGFNFPAFKLIIFLSSTTYRFDYIFFIVLGDVYILFAYLPRRVVDSKLHNMLFVSYIYEFLFFYLLLSSWLLSTSYGLNVIDYGFDYFIELDDQFYYFFSSY